MWIRANPNYYRDNEPDCVVRAIAIATGDSWEKVHWELCMLSHREHTMPSVNWLWDLYLKNRGFRRFELPESCPECITVKEFARRYPDGTYIIGTGHHAVCVDGGNWYDAYDSGGMVPSYFYKKKGRE